MNMLLTATGALALFGFCYYENNCLYITRIDSNFNLNNKLRILQLSDLHSKTFGKNNRILYKKIEEQKPDIIVATGDLIDSSLKNMNETIDFLVAINNISPLIYIAGNNENRCGKLDEIIYKLKENNVIALKNEIVTLNINSNTINILGLVEDIDDSNKSLLKRGNSNYLYKNSNTLFKKLESMRGLKIVLSHYPENFEAIGEKSYSKYNFDIMMAGHAHGGQFILPFIGGLFAPGQGVLPRYYRGVYGDSKKLVVSRGLGNSGFPLRLFNRPEIVIIDIE